MTVRLRPAFTSDIDAIMSVMATAFEPQFGEAWSASQMLGSLASDSAWARIVQVDSPGTRTAGFSLCRRIGPEAELLLIGVAPLDRGQGHGSRLLDAAKADAAASGVETMFLEVRDGNIAALALYRVAGFSPVGRRSAYYRGPGTARFDAITLRCDLVAARE